MYLYTSNLRISELTNKVVRPEIKQIEGLTNTIQIKELTNTKPNIKPIETSKTKPLNTKKNKELSQDSDLEEQDFIRTLRELKAEQKLQEQVNASKVNNNLFVD